MMYHGVLLLIEDNQGTTRGGGASNASNCLVPLIMSAKENHTQT